MRRIAVLKGNMNPWLISGMGKLVADLELTFFNLHAHYKKLIEFFRCCEDTDGSGLLQCHSIGHNWFDTVV